MLDELSTTIMEAMWTPPAGVVQQVRLRYGLDVHQTIPLCGGLDNRARSWRLETDRGGFVLRVDHGVLLETARWLSEVQRRIEPGGVPCPLLIAAQDDAVAFQAQGASVTVSTFVDGPRLNRDDPRKVRAAGAALARIHRAGEGISGPGATTSPVGVDGNSPGLQDSDLDRWHREFVERLGEALTRGVVHGDSWAENLKWTNQGKVAVVDWWAGHSAVQAREMAWATWTLGHDDHDRLSVDRASQFMAGYCDVHGALQPELRKALMPLMRYELRAYIQNVLRNDDPEYGASLVGEFCSLRDFDPSPLFDPPG